MDDSASFVGADGVEYVSIPVAKSGSFAADVIAEWSARDGRDRRWMLRHSAITVPAEILDTARIRSSMKKGKTNAWNHVPD